MHVFSRSSIRLARLGAPERGIFAKLGTSRNRLGARGA
jgi:hypothetical protein